MTAGIVKTMESKPVGDIPSNDESRPRTPLQKLQEVVIRLGNKLGISVKVEYTFRKGKISDVEAYFYAETFEQELEIMESLHLKNGRKSTYADHFEVGKFEFIIYVTAEESNRRFAEEQKRQNKGEECTYISQKICPNMSFEEKRDARKKLRKAIENLY